MECRAVLLNINRGHNKELLEKCRRLWEYSEFIAEVNDNLAKEYSLKKAINKAMDSCIEKGILEDILVKNQAEVLHMLLTEYDEERHMRDTYKEGYEEGEQAGRYSLLAELVQKKQACGKSIEIIADELEEDVEVIRQIIKKQSK